MQEIPTTLTLNPWRTADHLHWLCHAPQLLHCRQSFSLAEYLPDDLTAQLDRWSKDPARRPGILSEPFPRRLGYYFERLYQAVMTDLLGWTLLAKNLQVRDEAGQTVGELDFLLRNPVSGQVEHHEIAVKFYLAYGNPDTLWYGPNNRDRLDRKVARLLEHQSRLTKRQETRQALAGLGITEPVTARIFMPGYLFYPAQGSAAVPDFVPGNHLQGSWRYLHQVHQQDTRRWVPLQKPHWLGTWIQPDEPDPEHAASALKAIADHRQPRLFAVLHPRPDGLWAEVDRLFVVPDHWPSAADSPASLECGRPVLG